MALVKITPEQIVEHIENQGRLTSFCLNLRDQGVNFEWDQMGGLNNAITRPGFEIQILDDLVLDLDEYYGQDYVSCIHSDLDVANQKINELEHAIEGFEHNALVHAETVAYLDAKLVKAEAEITGAQHRVREQAETIVKYIGLLDDQKVRDRAVEVLNDRPWWKVW